jgi:ribosomal protein S18 acetylase RimI-like enzyme
MIDYATMSDLKQVDELAYLVITDMKESNIPQWEYTYPRKEHFLKDIENKALIVYREGNEILGCMAIYEENDRPYKTIHSWQKEHSIVLHRILVHPTIRNKGIAKQMLEFAIELGKHSGYESIKIDTHLENYKMRAFLKKNKFIEGDYIKSIDRIAYEYILEESK